VYREQTAPLMRYHRKELITIDGWAPSMESSQRVLRALRRWARRRPSEWQSHPAADWSRWSGLAGLSSSGPRLHRGPAPPRRHRRTARPALRADRTPGRAARPHCGTARPPPVAQTRRLRQVSSPRKWLFDPVPLFRNATFDCCVDFSQVQYIDALQDRVPRCPGLYREGRRVV
jgi:hypothetical protein